MPVAFAVLTLILFGDTLVVPGRVAAERGSDLRAQYLPWREFAFSQIRAGHFPLWNPYAFCGTPFFGDPQSGMLYPANWLFLLFSPERAASWMIAGHFFLAAYFMGLWRRARGASVVAAILSGVIYACSGPIITNLRPGHLMLLCAAAWGPVLFWCMDEIISAGNWGRVWKWVWIGVGVEALLQFNGYPQFCYYSGIGVGLYAVIRLMGKPRLGNLWSSAPTLALPRSTGGGEKRGDLLARTIAMIRLPDRTPRIRAVGAIAMIFVGGCAIAAAQILATAQFAGESVRAGGLPFARAADFSLAPENVLTLFVPGLFGDGVNFEYWGRWVWWEGCLFVGPAAVALAVYGAMKDRKNRHLAWMAIVLIVLALGASTAVFGVLYHWMPGFDHFRGTNRFGLIAVMFVAAMAGAGWDRLEVRAGRGMAISLAIVGLVVACGAGWAAVCENGGPGVFSRIVAAISATGQSLNISGNYQPTLAAEAAHFAARELGTAAVVVLIVAGLFALIHSSGAARRKIAAGILAALAMGQVVWFAWEQRATSDRDPHVPHQWAEILETVPPGDRAAVTASWLGDSGERGGFLNTGGYNPLLLKRTAEVLGAAQRQDVADVGQTDPAGVEPRLMGMLRAAAVIPNWPLGAPFEIHARLPRFLLVDRYVQVADAAGSLAEVVKDTFDPATEVVLEAAPVPAPVTPGRDESAGSVRLLSETTDSVELEADLPAAEILLITDAYSAGWRAAPMEASVQRKYQVLAADHCLRGIPLAAGHHHFRVEYRPGAVVVGAWISAAALVAYAGGAIWMAAGFRRRRI